MRWLLFLACATPPTIRIDGSSSAYPHAEAKARAYALAHPGVEIAVGISGSAGGLKKLCRGEVDIAETSRRATPEEACGAREVVLKRDSIAIIVHASAAFVDRLSADELRRMWQADSRLTHWSELRPDWPALPLRLYGASMQSHTFTQFSTAVLGKPNAMRHDFFGSENDYLVTYGVAHDRGGVGFVGSDYLTADVRRVPADVRLDRTLYLYVRAGAPAHVDSFVASLP